MAHCSHLTPPVFFCFLFLPLPYVAAFLLSVHPPPSFLSLIAIYTEGVINSSLIALRAISKRLPTLDYGAASPSLFVPHVPVDLLSRLVLLSSNFLNQFMALGGLGALRDADALSPSAPVKVIVNALLLVCQVINTVVCWDHGGLL